ncbi:cbb3-type cytochrome c oxidase subunit 3 [Lysobacter sp. 13A]|uniref:Cbb3-type cytochrome c oxidase subunit 3 n=1 Tax=Novilysobacter selenitireducens TaxID=2872639 RepID=A0ABS7T7X1_9GAMM|nr:cbb3-type cytochrome c oxidase subunit 3 [Lysobacter selenitireducens]
MRWSPTCRTWVATYRGVADMWSGIVTTVLLVAFVVGWIWAWSPRRKRDFDEAARLPLDDEETRR